MTAATTQAGEYLTFRLGDMEFGIDILQVQEIRSYEQPTRTIGVSDSLLGVINLRGVIVPVVDLRPKFGHPLKYDICTVTVILNIGDLIIGVVVDSVSDVLELGADQIRPVTNFPNSDTAKAIKHLGIIGERLIHIMDVEAVLGSPEVGLLQLS